MTTDLLTLTQLLSPSFPVGAFAYSSGLESAIAGGAVTSRATLEAWLTDLICLGSGRSDAVLLNLAYAADPADIASLDTTARAFAATAERLRETDLQGAAFCETVSAVWGHDLPPLCYPVGVGRVGKLLNLDPQDVTALYLHAFAANICAAAMRLVPLGQIDGQKALAALKPYCVQIAGKMQTATLDDLHSATWVADIMSMRHETQYSRVFRS
ncbi:urease accessory protein UreF [Yoonia sp. 208BN28-4]|uniref:urease accessory protein UreF n=1 Tax=Yoonia sp. 208BN28-4 TaxID=3126505 RepID=UPI0030A03652